MTDCVHVGKYISIIYRYSQVYISEALEPYHISASHYSFLLTLYRGDGISQENLSEQMSIDKAATKRAIDHLEKAGYVTRKPNPNDKRAYELYLTEQAMALKEEIREIFDKWHQIITANMSETAIIQLIDQLEKASNNAKEAVHIHV